jgi:plasmid stabilization system protein ParE
MRSVEWSAEALADFDDQINFIALLSKKNAALVADRVEAAVALLQSAPTGRFGRI